ncbi:calmodulin-regulated spectrin-associated protein patronin isoform X15 [Anticarsia gemmatalis]|uniref:calmodulin-regulated spectrin-associated protein patronin isoform X15 n=1 Tax=Anticarsia gemmatalis TaxID=129554 RepID=UPI003F775244
MVAMVASASGYGTLRRFLSVPEGQHGVPEAGVVPSTSVAVSSKQRASIKWLLSKAFNNRVPDNLQEPFYRDHEDQEHLKPPIVGGLANAELYCLALANMYSDPNYHSLNHWNILQTLARKGVHVPDPPDCALTETVLIQTNPLKMSGHMSVIEALMVLYAREVVTADRVAAAAQRFGSPVTQIQHHEDGILCWINAACAALNKAEEDSSMHVPMLKSLQEVCDGTALAALISFYCPEALPRGAVRVGRMASIQDCLHNLMLVHDFCRHALPHDVFHMLPEDVTYMRGSMRQNLVAMLADLFNMLEVHPVKSVKYPGSEERGCNSFGVRHKRCLPPPPPAPIPDLRAERLDSALPPFSVPRSPSAMSGRGRAACRSASSTPERRSASPARDDFVVHRPKHITTLAAMARRDDDSALELNITAAGRPSNWAESRDGTFAGRRSRRSSVSDDSQLTVENFGGSQDRLHFAGRNPEKELATLANVRKISAPAGPLDYNPPLRSSRQDIRGSIQFFHGDFQNGSENEQRQKVERQHSQPDNEPYFPIRRQLSSDTITLSERAQNFGFSAKGGGDSFYLNDRDSTDGDNTKTSFADLNKIRSNGDQSGIQSVLSQEEPTERRKSTTFVTPPPNTTTWQQQFMQQENHPNGEDLTDETSSSPSGGQMAAQLNNIRLKLEEKRRRIEQEKRRMEMAVNRQRQQLGQQAFLQAVTRGKGARTPADDEPKQEPPPQQEMVVEPPSQRDSVDTAVLEQYQQSIAKMNSSLQDIQSDIARLASQQTQLQQQQQQQHQQQQAKQLFQQPAPLQQPPQPPQSPYQQQQHYQPNIPQLLEQEDGGETNEKGFYISFDNDQPKRPKPPLRAKRGSPKKERSTEFQSPERSPENTWNERLPQPPEEEFVVHRSTGLEQTIRSNDVSERRETPPRDRPQRVNNAEPAAMVIGELNPDPNSAEEMERKKERIMLLSLQRRQRADEARARADAAAAARRAREEQANELKLARKEEQARRREQILHQYKLKKAIEEAEREGKVLDKSEFMDVLRGGNTPAPTPGGPARLRGKAGGGRARPKTIHVDSSALHAAEGMLATKQPSSTNLTAGGGGTMRRDYYRGSQDSLAERAGLYRESPVEDRGGMSPGSASSGPLGRRGSCKTSRERVNEEPQSTRGRSKYSTYGSNFKAGRKSSSLMNLCDSGLGRATPPRRAASPGVRTLGSPASHSGHSGPASGPGSLPGAIGKRRHHPADDTSDVSSTHSSIMDYSGPRLYKQPTTKSNRGIMLNAVEYCVFPGAVNAEAKRRVLEEIARSESKHFLVLFRDAGCQFRALYSYCPDSEQVTKLYGTGPKHVNDRMFDKFFKYNSGSKCFSQVHTKHLTVTIDAFTIHNSLWQGKKVQLPSKKDMALVI